MIGLGAIGSLVSGAASLGGLFSSLFGGGEDTSGIEDAINRQNALQDRAMNIAERQYYLGRSDLGPYRTSGLNALIPYMDLMGLQRPDLYSMLPGDLSPRQMDAVKTLMGEKAKYAPSSAWLQTTEGRQGRPEGYMTPEEAAFYLRGTDVPQMIKSLNLPKYNPMETLQATPGYQGMRDALDKAVTNYYAKKGMSLSGPALKALQNERYAMDFNDYNALLNRIQGVKDQGQAAAAGTVNAGNQSVGQQVNAMLTSGQMGTNNALALLNARESSYNSPFGFLGYGLGSLGNLFSKFGKSGNSQTGQDFNWPKPEIMS